MIRGTGSFYIKPLYCEDPSANSVQNENISGFIVLQKDKNKIRRGILKIEPVSYIVSSFKQIHLFFKKGQSSLFLFIFVIFS